MAWKAFLLVSVTLFSVSLSCQASGFENGRALPLMRSQMPDRLPEANLLRLRGGMADSAAQLAEIRAQRAKQYEAIKSEKENSIARQEAEEATYDGAQRAWTTATEKICPKIISTKKDDMPIGDARNFYLDKEVTYLRNKNTGMVVELMHESEGWFQYSTVEQGKLKQISTDGLLMDVHRWYAPGFLDQIKSNPLKSTLVPPQGLRFGPWTCAVVDKNIVIGQAGDESRLIHLTAEGLMFVDHSTGRAIQVDSFGATQYISMDEAERQLGAA